MSKRLVILGAGESGVGAALLGKARGYDVFVSDYGVIQDQYKNELNANNITWEEKQHTESSIINANLVVKSPGIPDTAPIVEKLLDKQVSIISEIEFGHRYTDAFMICITGSNGKTTTTSIIYDMLQQAGLNVGLAGNIGFSLARQVVDKSYDYYVIELSSFQLDNMYEFRANISILMNITPDHLDRYDYQMSRYVDSKFRITNNQLPEDHFIYFSDDVTVTEKMKNLELQSTLLPFSLFPIQNKDGASIQDHSIQSKLNGKWIEIDMNILSLQGKHNACNVMAAVLTGQILNIDHHQMKKSLTSFRGVEHRLEACGEKHGIDFINDSKATNISSSWFALESMTKPTIWIVGGVDKGNDYNELKSFVQDKVKAIVCLGKDNRKIIEAFSNEIDVIVECQSMEDAVEYAVRYSASGDAVLLSPACASFDLFRSYIDRGDQFKKCVENLL